MNDGQADTAEMSVSARCPRRVAVKVAYRGEGFHGSQRQPGLRTVEGEVLDAIETSRPQRCLHDPDLKASSRTDAGVGATGNVMAFHTCFTDDAALLRALNSASDDVHFLAVADIDPGMNIRHADRRSYLYRMPIQGIDPRRVEECVPLFIGRHDFCRFCRDEGKGTVEEITAIEVNIGDVIDLKFVAPRFLWNQIRRIVAALKAAGRGRIGPDEIRRALEGEDLQWGLADPSNLLLLDVEYDCLVFRHHDDVVLRRKLQREMHRINIDLELHRRLLI